jgi:dipeptide/tripeptide permease
MAINIGAVGSGFLIPWVQGLNFYGNEGDGYPVAFGICSAVMGIATVLFILGESSYRVVPPAGIFLPWELAKTGAFYTRQLMRSKGDKAAAQEETARKFGRELLIEYFDLVQVLLVLLPSTFFWMAFDQSGSSWQGLTDQMNPDKFLSSIMVNTVVNPIFIVILSPVFSSWVYPCIDKAFPKKFGLLTRMVAGMILTGISFLICAVYQGKIDKNCTLTEFESNGLKQTVCYDATFSTAWFVIPYFVITTGEVLFSISGLNFAYTEVGKRMKSSTAALWLLTVAFGNLLVSVVEVRKYVSVSGLIHAYVRIGHGPLCFYCWLGPHNILLFCCGALFCGSCFPSCCQSVLCVQGRSARLCRACPVVFFL